MAFIATDSKHQSSLNLLLVLVFFLPCYYVKGSSFLHFAGSQEGSNLSKATDGGSNGAGRNPLSASPRLVDLGREKMRKEKSWFNSVRRVGRGNESTWMVRLQVCLTKPGRQHSLCDCATHRRGRKGFCPSCLLVSLTLPHLLNPFPSTPGHLSMQICISSPCSEAHRCQAVTLKFSLRGTSADPWASGRAGCNRLGLVTKTMLCVPPDVPLHLDARCTQIPVVGMRCTARMLTLLLQRFPALLCGMGGQAASQRGCSTHRDGVELLISLKWQFALCFVCFPDVTCWLQGERKN